MPSFDDEHLQIKFIVPKPTDKRMTEDSTPNVALKTDKLAKPKDSVADLTSIKDSSDRHETSKDSGSEKDSGKFSDPLQSANWNADNSEIEDDVRGKSVYFAETVDFPDSPLHLKLLKRRSREAQGLDTEDDEEEDSTTFSIMGKGPQHSKTRKDRPRSLSATHSKSLGSRKKITVNPDVLSSELLKDDDDRHSTDTLSNRSDLTPVDGMATPDDIDTPDDLDDDPFETTDVPEDRKNWKLCMVGGEERKIDMKVIEPYKKVLSHGGYIGSSNLAIIVFSACYLPNRSRIDYDYVMDNLFLYVLTTLAQLVAEDYVLIYLHGATSRSCMPSFGWLKRCYQMIDRRLRKNLKGLYLVHPTFWLKTIVIMTKPFISSKFSRKLRFVSSLMELEELIPMDHVCIPEKVKEYDGLRILLA